MVKQRRDSITQFEAGKRQDLADLEKAEVTVLQAYMPQQLTDAEIDAAIAAAIAATGAAGPAGMGKVMAELKPKLAGRADMTAVSAKVKAKLALAQRADADPPRRSCAALPIIDPRRSPRRRPRCVSRRSIRQP